MIPHEQVERLKDELLSVLQEDAHNSERLLTRLEAISRENGVEAHAALLMILTQLSFDEGEARAHWEAIVRHRHEMSLALGRDVGVRVAVFDYFVNVNRRLRQPSLIDIAMERTRDDAAGSDPLTGLSGDRAFRTALLTELRRARRYHQKTAVALFDLDAFGDLALRVGDLVARRLLREAAIVLNNKIRDIDLAARPGEDEFVLLLPETSRNGALLVAERFRREMEAHFRRREIDGKPVGLTVSGGVAAYPEDATSAEELLAAAAQALYAAKASGRNAVQVHQPERRRYLRFDLAPERCEVEVLAPRDLGPRPARDLSRRGLLFSVPEPLEVGEEIELRLVSGLAGPAGALRLRGRVVRLEEIPVAERPPDGARPDDRFEVGVVFEPGPSGDVDLIEILERSIARDPDRPA